MLPRVVSWGRNGHEGDRALQLRYNRVTTGGLVSFLPYTHLMKHVCRLALALMSACLTVLAVAQPLMWFHDHKHRANSKITRDYGGSLYYVSVEPASRGWTMITDKFTPGGEKVWSREFGNGRPDTETFHVASVAADASHVFAVANRRLNDVSGAVVGSYLVALRGTNGNYDLNHQGDGEAFASVAVSSNHLALLSQNVATGVASVTFFQTGTWTNMGTVNLGVVASVAEVRLDVAGNAYVAASNTNGTVQISKCSAAGGIAFQTTLDASNPRINEKLLRLEVDTVAGRVYGLGTVAYSPTDQDVMLYVVNSVTGAQVGIQSIRSSTADDFSGDLSVVPGSGGVIASAYTPATETTVVARRSTTSATVWSVNINGTPAGAGRSHGTDADGQLVVMSPISASVVAMDRLDRVTGSTLGRETFSLGADAKARQFITSAGSYFVSSEYRTYVPQAWVARFQRLQSSRLSFTQNNRPGGETVYGRIHRTPTTTVEETWSVTSGNPAVASVPATVNVPIGVQTFNFPIVLSPVSVNTNVSINIRYAGFADQQTLTVVPPGLWQLRAIPAVVVGGVPTVALAELVGDAPTGGLTLTLSSNKPAVASVPGTGVVPAGADFAEFPVTTYAVNSNQGVVISATTGAVTKTAFMAVNAPSLTSIAVNPGTLKGGVTGSLILNLNGIAPTGGFSIVLFSGLPATVTLPASASVAAGQTTRNVSMPTAAVTATTQVTIFATRSGIYKTATVTVTP